MVRSQIKFKVVKSLLKDPLYAVSTALYINRVVPTSIFLEAKIHNLSVTDALKIFQLLKGINDADRLTVYSSIRQYKMSTTDL